MFVSYYIIFELESSQGNEKNLLIRNVTGALFQIQAASVLVVSGWSLKKCCNAPFSSAVLTSSLQFLVFQVSCGNIF